MKLTVANGTGSHTTTRSVNVVVGYPPVAAFSFTPGAPVAGQSLAFTDASTQSPTSWSWGFGDGSPKSSAQNPSHVYTNAGTYSVVLKATNAFGNSTKRQSLVVGSASASNQFSGSLVLGSPAATSVKANLYAPSQSGTVKVAWGNQSGTYTRQTSEQALQAGTPLELTLEGLNSNSAYYYRLFFKATGAPDFTQGEECRFHTARAPGSTYTFCVQGDSHPERAGTQFDAALYSRTLATAAADQPDFYVLLGDDFSVDTLDPLTVTAAQVMERYTLQRPFLGAMGRNAPLFLVNGNHEQAARYLLDGTPNNVAVWAQNARNSLYSQPAPDGFYTGNPEVVPYIGLLRNTFAWTWGDALFVVIDPYWASSACVDNPFFGGDKRTNLWDVTHGDAQYQWLKATLETSKAKYKFVFAHHVMGTGRGGVELAGLYEWGGRSPNGAWLFDSYRPAWAGTPIHQLLAANSVTLFFQGHDHLWAHQQLDGVTYQTLPEPADPTYTLWNADAYLSGEKLPNSGYARVTVSSSGVKVEYVRTWLPKDEGGGRINGQVAASYTLP
ncbi:MAG: PKD domain-containing protein [Firmicutes bacterium]|nr:PKD domain-containing protein [Bacillota bacterium]